MPLSTALDVNLTASYTNTTAAPGTGAVPFALARRTQMLTGTSTGLADKIYTVSTTIAASGTTNLDLAGSVTDVFGVTLTIVKLKMLIVRAAAANVNNVVVGPASSNGVVGLFSGTTPALIIPPGGLFAWTAPAAGITITASTGDLLTFTNSSSGTSVTYDVTVVGTSA